MWPPRSSPTPRTSSTRPAPTSPTRPAPSSRKSPTDFVPSQMNCMPWPGHPTSPALPATWSARPLTVPRPWRPGWTGSDPGSLLNEVKSFARQRPGTFLLLAAGAGVLAGRLTRSLSAGAPESGTTAARSTGEYGTGAANGSPSQYGSQYGGDSYSSGPGGYTPSGGAVPPPPVQVPGPATTTAGFDGGAPGSHAGEPVTPALPARPARWTARSWWKIRGRATGSPTIRSGTATLPMTPWAATPSPRTVPRTARLAGRDEHADAGNSCFGGACEGG